MCILHRVEIYPTHNDRQGQTRVDRTSALREALLVRDQLNERGLKCQLRGRDRRANKISREDVSAACHQKRKTTYVGGKNRKEGYING
jgi:hypothetical protein